ncbi:DNA/RNA non-specific endonuclease [Polynucleobacter sp. AP-RePozz3-80-G7]|uniref:DNA/RNA non-specific endonuclease n=1 Tax=Polynucleobacter sp. AP-RePozz3-80-G7 TaxID=2689105 RepID=UPI001C0E8DFE|nr:DNA/RNA non-specific endonuclease [Polynucleobacter sp. AP-RePozz3-80-G7]MBU3638590.1 DNA/RNA non-specific endonuclease [Polynucleobacter sp. AP-RePozz3-80-G7]
MKFLRHLLALVAIAASLNALAAFEDCKDLFPAQQIPMSPQVGRDLCFDSFAIYYSPQDKKPIYAVEKLNREQLSAPHPRRSNQFYEEARLPFSERALLSDYRGSGFDRGHNAPAGDMSNERSMAQSFSLANMMPQARQNNQGIWAKNVEEPTRAYVKRSSGDIYVYTGSIGNSGSIGRSRVTIPSHLYKLVYDSNKNIAWAYWIKNTNEASMTAPISYPQLIQKTGIDFHLPVGEDDSTNNTSAQTHDIKGQGALVGGWYPIFFDDYSSSKLNDVINNIKSGKIANIQIQYDRNETLAKQISSQIESQAKFKASLIQSSPPESATVTYERNRVTLIIRSK